MVTGPRPRFVALPIPTGIRPFPVAVAVGLPIRFNARWMPAAAVGTDGYPGTIGSQGFIKIGDRVNLNAR